MKVLLNIIVAMSSALFCSAQDFNVGIDFRQFTNQTQSQEYTSYTSGGYPTNNLSLTTNLFIEKITPSNIYYRFTAGTSQSNTNSLYQNVGVDYFGGSTNNYLAYLALNTYKINRKVQNYDASIGIGKIISYKKICLRTSAELYINRYQSNTFFGNGVVSPSQGSSFSTITYSTSLTPYNQYLINYYVSLHYSVCKNFSIGIQLDNGISFTYQKQTENTIANGYQGGTLLTTAINAEHINNQVFSTYFLTPSISIIYNFHKQKIKE